jgi:aspartate/methionine/tyrosine aminotransferase
MKEAVVELIVRRGAPQYDPYGEVVITDGDGSAILNALLVLTDPDDEVVLTDPTYAGMLQRVRLVGAVPKLVPLRGDGSGWRLDLDALTAALSIRTRVLFLMNPAIPSGWVASDRELVNAYREVGAYGRRYGQLTVCSTEHEAAARRRRWRRAAS